MAGKPGKVAKGEKAKPSSVFSDIRLAPGAGPQIRIPKLSAQAGAVSGPSTSAMALAPSSSSSSSLAGMQQPGILTKIADEMELVSRNQKTGVAISKPNFKRFVLNESVDTSQAQVPAKPEVGEIQVMDVMPREEALDIGASGRVVANSETRKNCVEFLLVNKIKMPSGLVVVKIPDAEIFATVIGRANADLVDMDPDYCLALEHAEPNEDGIGKLTLNLQPGSGGQQFIEVIRGYSTPEVQYELYPTAPLLKKHALTIFLHDGHFIRNARLATTIAKCNPGLKGSFTLVDIKGAVG